MNNIFTMNRPERLAGLVDSRINSGADQAYIVEHVSPNLDYRQEVAASFSNSNIQAQLNIPGGQFIYRVVFLEVEFQAVFAGADQGSPLLELGVNDAPRQFPIMSCCNNLTCDIGGTSFSVRPYETVHQLGRVLDRSTYNTFMSACPAMPDFYQDYAGATSGGAGADPLRAVGTNGYMNARGGFKSLNVVANTNTAATVRWRSWEPLLVGCFDVSKPHQSLGLIGMANNVVNFTLNFSSLSYAWSHSANGKTFTAAPTVTINSAPIFHFYVMQQLPGVPVPSLLHYQFLDYSEVVNGTDITLASGAQTSYTHPLLRPSVLPEYIVFWVRRRFSDRTYLTSDVYARIDRISINMNGREVLSQASPLQLYQMSVKNGLNVSFSSFFSGATVSTTPAQNDNGCGSLIVVSMEDIGLPAELAADALYNGNIQIQATFTNTSAAQVVYNTYSLLVYNNLITVGNGTYTNHKGVISTQEVLQSLQELAASDDTPGTMSVSEMQLSGQGFFGKLGKAIKHGAKKLWHATKHVAKGIDKGIGYVEKYAPMAAALGAGYIGGTPIGGTPIGGTSIGGTPIGGAVRMRRMRGSGAVEYTNSDLSRSIKDFVRPLH